MPRRTPPSPAALASFTAQGEVTGVWPVGAGGAEIVLRDGHLVPRPPSEVLPKDARIATVAWRHDESGRPALALEGANLLIGPTRVSPGRREHLGDGDVLAVDHRDVGERPAGVVGALLVSREDPHRRRLRCLDERDDGSIQVTRPGAERAWLQVALAAAVLGALPCAAVALGQQPGLPTRSTLLLAAAAFLLVAVLAVAYARFSAHAGPVLSWDANGLRLGRRGVMGPPERLTLEELDGFRVRLGRGRDGRWRLEATLRARGTEIALDAGPHLTLRSDGGLPAVAALEARRLDWVDVFRRATLAMRRSPDAFVTVHTDPDWPPEGARIALATERLADRE